MLLYRSITMVGAKPVLVWSLSKSYWAREKRCFTVILEHEPLWRKFELHVPRTGHRTFDQWHK